MFSFQKSSYLLLLTNKFDGLHLQNSQDVTIDSSKLAYGHGISIGILVKANTVACVSNITVSNANIHDTMIGVRIKTWQGGLGSMQRATFSNIQVSNVKSYKSDTGNNTDNRNQAIDCQGDTKSTDETKEDTKEQDLLHVITTDQSKGSEWLEIVPGYDIVGVVVEKEMPTTEATAQGIASMLCAHGPEMNGEYSPYGKMLKVPEIMEAA
ncbi:polygalacturonase [Tanacetum coccineum]